MLRPGFPVYYFQLDLGHVLTESLKTYVQMVFEYLKWYNYLVSSKLKMLLLTTLFPMSSDCREDSGSQRLGCSQTDVLRRLCSASLPH